jgi:hypothetical protein
MSIRVLCPNGHELVAELAHVGRKIRCPACKVVMVVPNPQGAAAPPPPPQAIQQEAPAPRRQPPPQQPLDQLDELDELPEEPPPMEEERPVKTGMKTGARMRLANIGLGFHYAKVLCMLVSTCLTLLAFGLVLMAASARSQGLLRVTAVVSCISQILILVTPILGGTGSLLCFWLPKKSNSRVLVIVTFGLEVGGTAFMGFALLMMLTGGAAAAGDVMEGGHGAGGVAMAGFGAILFLLAALTVYASFILFLLVLRTLAKYLRDRSTADEAIRQMIMFLIVTLGGGVIWTVLLFVLPRNIGGLIVFFVMTIGWVIAMAVVLFGILTVIGTIRQGIATRW